MIKRIKYLCVTLLISSFLSACSDIDVDTKGGIDNEMIVTQNTIQGNPFVGIGPQWGGYDNIEKWTGSNTFSDADWQKLLKRVAFMRPGLIRIMGSPGWNYMVNGEYKPEHSSGVLFRILDICEAQGINVMWGEWGERPLAGNLVNTEWLDNATNFLDYLINTKGYTCLKYYNMCNEPAGDWSSIAGDYNLWQRTYEEIFARLEAKGLDSQITVIAPDIAIWNDTHLLDWITRPMEHFGDKIGAYDIHAYPTDDQVKGGSFKKVISVFRDIVPPSKDMIMGELGFKYDPKSETGKENLKRIEEDKYADDDSNMMIYDAFYGVDVADAVIQNMQAGYNGVVLWMMDDAMYDDGNDRLKRWGFWNILGEEKFENAEDENIRPWFYPISLMCRYFPQGAILYNVKTPDKKGVQAIAAMKDNKYTIAITNTHATTYSIDLKMGNGIILDNANHYSFIAGEGAQYEGKVDADGFPVAEAKTTIDFSNDKSYNLTIKGQSVTIITNMH